MIYRNSDLIWHLALKGLRVTGEIEVSSFIKPKDVTLMLENSARFIKHKVGLLNLAEEWGNVSKACKVMSLSRDKFYRYKEAVESGSVESLFDKSQRLRVIQWRSPSYTPPRRRSQQPIYSTTRYSLSAAENAIRRFGATATRFGQLARWIQ